MKVKFIGQGYNLELNTSVAQELINALNDTDFHSFKCLVAFASFSGVSGLSPHIQKSKKHFKNYQLIVGIDNNGTSKEALEELLNWNIDTFVYYTRAINIFHPKIYLFEGMEKSIAIIGSNNLTEMGLSKNVEGAVLVEYNTKEEGQNGVIKQIESYFKNIFNNEDINLKKLSTEFISDLEKTDVLLPSDSQRNRIHDEKVEQTSSGDLNKVSNLFDTSKLQKNPIGFVPKRKSKKKENKDLSKIQKKEDKPREKVVSPKLNLGWKIDMNKDVLIAEVGGGDRWKQVNFPKKMFQNFFGAKIGDNTYHIKIKEVSSDGKTNEVESRQAVTVTSQNYRFEIGAAKGEYPTGINRPIVIFLKISDDRFLYALFMPDNLEYNRISKYLVNNYSGASRNLKRIIVTHSVLKKQFPKLPFWNIIY